MSEDKIVTIERLAFGGEGVGRIDGKVVFVPWTAPGDTVKVRIVSDQNRFSRAEVVEVLEPSPVQVQPRCSVFGVCGGCQWQHIDYPAQLLAKEAILKETLERVGQLKDLAMLPIIPSPQPWNYRHRIQLKRDPRGRIGFLEAGSHTVVEFDNCEIAASSLNEMVHRLRNNGRGEQDEFELVMSEGGEKVLVQALDDPERIFSQVNPPLNQKLIVVTLDFVFGRSEAAFARKRNLVELYSGNGNLTFPLAAKAGQVVAVEESRAAVAQAERTAKIQSVSNVEFICGSAEWGLKTQVRKGVVVDTLVLDPPRSGAKEILDLILVLKPRLIIYVSCDPATLARDLKFLVQRHYQIEALQPLDMFPQTYHIESVVKLVRKNGG